MNHRVWLALPLMIAGMVVAGSAEGPRRPQLAPEVRNHLDEARANGLYRERGDRVQSPALERGVARNPDSPAVAWVFFTDKGVGTEGSYRRSLDRVRAGLGARVLQRRAPLGPDYALGFTDLPVYAPYVEALEGAGFRVRRVSRWLNAASIEGPGRNLAALAASPFVRWIQPVLMRRAPLEPEIAPSAPLDRSGVSPSAAAGCPVPPSDPLESAFYGSSYQQLDQIQALELQRQGYSGAGVRVMILDTGFKKDHPAFGAAHIVAEWDFVNEDGNTQNEGVDSVTQHNHGTGCWGTLGGYGRGTLIGPAFAAEFLLAKTEDVPREVHAEEDNYVAALEWGDLLGVDVTSASLAYFTFQDGTDYTIQDLNGDVAVITIAVDLAAQKGIVCVNAMGNSGPAATTLNTPADADTVIAVGAADSCGAVASFSSRGPTYDGRIKPEISARGYRTTWAVAGTNGYGLASGTSLSTPLIGGLAALLKEAHPTWTPVQLRDAVMGTGTQVGAPDNSLGHGLAQGVAALTFGGAVADPPRMTLPFRLSIPANMSTVATGSPTFVWSTSAAKQPGDQATYRLLVDDDALFASPDTFFAGTATSMAPPLNLASGETRWWKVVATGNGGFGRESLNVSRFTVGTVTQVPDDGVAGGWLLGPPAPNPAPRGTTFHLRVPPGSRAALEILDLAGRRVRRLEAPGTGAEEILAWDGRDASGRLAPAGVYFYRLAGGPGHLVGKLIVIR